MSTEELEQDLVEAYDEENERELAMKMLEKMAVPVERVERPGVLVEKWAAVKEKFESHMSAAQECITESNRLAEALMKQHGIKVQALGIGGITFNEPTTIDSPSGINISVNQQPVSVDEIRSAASIPTGGSESSFAQQISKGLEGAMRGLQF